MSHYPLLFALYAKVANSHSLIVISVFALCLAHPGFVFKTTSPLVKDGHQEDSTEGSGMFGPEK